jgi:hypothetical protein
MRAVVIMAVALAGCRFAADEGATRFRCDLADDCPPGLACTGGWCEEPAAEVADASPPDAVDLACPCSLWEPDAVPEKLDNNDGSAIETAVKLRADLAGRIVALRFYKAAASQGLEVGRVWSAEGALLGEVEYGGGGSASGWQEARLDPPVAVQADTTYLASVYIPSGDYVADVGYFLAARDRPPLHALADGMDGANGVFLLGAGFPDEQTFMASNYWVDVVFEED